ncbi:hypothetical protein ALP05_00677 [Pseudomonas caricapapayae]|uniref:Uncharacterized protein n=1 Tax=Pseudomonas caricapapayae TaxID=46678 RepID=A0A3M6F7T9_9PSED|nr:hypothetical protein [Pseudomonas caricapapayae]RMV76458.1 hypothetical protein ALP05_00677 [Pseudomonas caricapapayae]
MDKPEIFKCECRCSQEFRQKLVELAYLSGFIKKQKIEDPNNKDFFIDVSEFDTPVRTAFLSRTKGVSEMLMSIVKNNALIISGADKSDLRDIERKFNKTNSNISQLARLTEKQTFSVKGKPYDLEKLFHDFIREKTALGEQVNKKLEIKTYTLITSGKIFDAKIDLATHRDKEGNYDDRFYFAWNEQTNLALRPAGSELKPMILQLINDKPLLKEGAPFNNPLILEALEIYQRLNSDLEHIHTLKLEGKNYQIDLYKSLYTRKNECSELQKKLLEENINALRKS